jgi:hypothetical protein
MKGFAAALLCGIVVAAGFAHLTRDKWVEIPLAALFTVCFAAPAAIVTILAFLFAGKWRSRLQSLQALGLVMLIFCGSLWVGLPLRTGLAAYDQKAAREFCEFLSPTIERYHVEHGEFPDDVTWLVAEQGSGKLPKLIENGFLYRRRDKSFSLAFIAPDRPFAWHVFDSMRRAWDVEVD